LARPLRIDYPGAFQHVTSRGVAGGTIFFADEDREDFLNSLAEACERWAMVVHAYCLMTNHYHLELESREGKLSRAMQWLNEAHATGVNRRHGRVGHLFQGRFKSALVEAQGDLHELTRYIHMNPVRAGLVQHPADHRWSSYRTYIGLRSGPEWLETGVTLRLLGGKNEKEAGRAYRKFEQGVTS